MRVILATRNAHKVEEIADALAVPGIVFEGLDRHPEVGEIEETGDTFEANAILKAEGTARVTGLPSLADDSGLAVDALDGAPGVCSARFAGEGADDARNRAALVAALRGDGREPGGFAARFVCVLALAVPGEATRVVEGRCEGRIVLEERGSQGFGYDPLFVPEGHSRTFAEMTRSEKAVLSHRGRALAKAAPLLEALVASGRH